MDNREALEKIGEATNLAEKSLRLIGDICLETGSIRFLKVFKEYILENCKMIEILVALVKEKGDIN